MTDADTPTLDADFLDWNGDVIWVQRTGLLKIIEREAGGGSMRVVRHDGTETTVDPDAGDDGYFEIDEGKYLKPVYAPRRALILDRDTVVKTRGRELFCAAGGAILRLADGALRLIPRDELLRDFEAVAYPGELEEPALPFSGQVRVQQPVAQIHRAGDLNEPGQQALKLG